MTEAIARLRAKLARGESFELVGRYLYGIARNTMQRNEDLAVYDHALQLRIEARDELLAPLVEKEQRHRRDLDSRAYIDRLLDEALDAAIPIDRAFWTHHLEAAIAALSPLLMMRTIDSMVRIIATSYATPPRERQTLISRLIELRVQAYAA